VASITHSNTIVTFESKAQAKKNTKLTPVPLRLCLVWLDGVVVDRLGAGVILGGTVLAVLAANDLVLAADVVLVVVLDGHQLVATGKQTRKMNNYPATKTKHRTRCETARSQTPQQ